MERLTISSLGTILVLGLIAILLGIVVVMPNSSRTLPFPYTNIPLQELSTERIQRIQGALDYAKSNEWKKHLLLLQDNNNKVLRLLNKDNTRILFRNQVLGAESVAIRPSSSSSSSFSARDDDDDNDEELVMLDKFGYMHRAAKQHDTDDYQLLVGGGIMMNDDSDYVGPGRPLGFEFYNADTLIVADSLKGLVQVKLPPRQQQQQQDEETMSNSGGGGGDVEISILTNTVKVKVDSNDSDDGQSMSTYTSSILNYVNDLDIDHDHDCVYFTSSTRGVVAYNNAAQAGHYDTMRSFLLDLYSADVSGRLLQYNFKTRTTRLIMDDIWYANGVALSPDKDYVLVVETCGFRVIKKWLTGPKAGQQEDFITNLPGFPDGITQAKNNGGGYWISLVVPLSPSLHFMQSMAARYWLAWLQLELLRNVPMIQKLIIPKWACVIRVSSEGEIVEVVLDPRGSLVSTVSAVTEHNGQLFMGNLGGNFVSIVDLSK